MDIVSHLFLGRILKQALEKNSFEALSTPHFLLGNILPDIRPDLRFNPLRGHRERIKHTVEDSCATLLEEMASSQNPLEVGEEALHLGRYTHYFSDYFCHPHSRTYKGSPLHHLLYELGLTLYLIRNYSRISARILQMTPVPLSSVEAIKATFELEQFDYFSKPVSYERDILYSLRFNLVLGISLARLSSKPDLSKVA
ncbi:MAG: hypothetical protein AVO33_08045 [delta proteobacterium ML8_F1]|nr:MAG: hypothetical protein AVO33_08045 [delta proteobacterium ML8_F1]